MNVAEGKRLVIVALDTSAHFDVVQTVESCYRDIVSDRLLVSCGNLGGGNWKLEIGLEGV